MIKALRVTILFLIMATLFYPELIKANQLKGIIRGTVVDRQSGGALSGANVKLSRCRKGSVANQAGAFVINEVPIGLDTLCISFMGYQAVRKVLTFKPGETITVRISLQPRVLPMPGVTISALYHKTELRNLKIEPNPRILKSEYIRILPAVAVPDLYRALQSIPGVTSTNEVSPQLHVRGGNFDQNLVLLDGAVVYFPFHFFGLVSCFNPDMIDDIYFSPGGFSARYGNRLSSVLHINTINRFQKFKNRINLSLIGSDLTVGGKLGKKLGWMFSARASHFDLYKKITKNRVPFSIYDIFGKISLEFSPTQHLKLFAFRNRDVTELDDKTTQYLHSSIDSSQIKYDEISREYVSFRNQVYSATWESEWFKKIKSRFQLSGSIYSNSFDVRSLAEFPENLADKFNQDKTRVEKYIQESNSLRGAKINNSFRDFTAKFSIDFPIIPDFYVTAGSEHSCFNMDYGWKGFYDFNYNWIALFFDYAPEDSFSYRKNFSTTGVYVEGLWDIKPWLHLRQGLRFSGSSYIKKFSIEPRFNLKFDFAENWALKLAYGHFSQGLSTALEEGLVSFLELYFPIENGTNVETADHFIANVDYENSNGTGFAVTVYYKKFNGLLKSGKYNSSFVQTPGHARGFEAEVSSRIFGFNTSLSYVWSHSQRTYNGITYDTNFDQRHRFQLSTNRHIGKGWTFSAFWEFHTGQPYNPGVYYGLYRPYSRYKADGLDDYRACIMDVPRGRIRYPHYHRLDISLTRLIRKKKFTLEPYLSIRNVYFRKNILYYGKIRFEYDFDYDTFQYYNPHIERKAFWLRTIPTIGLRVGF